jgi:phycocyanin beta chain
MFDAFAKVVSRADSRSEYLSKESIAALMAMVAQGNKRLDIVNRITSNTSTIVAKAAQALFSEQPRLIAPGSNVYTIRRMAACLRDMEIILRYVTYATFAGDASVLDDRCLNGLQETYMALGVPISAVGAGVLKMKSAAIAIVNDPNGITHGDCSTLIAELGGYFDRVAFALDASGSFSEISKEHPSTQTQMLVEPPSSLPEGKYMFNNGLKTLSLHDPAGLATLQKTFLANIDGQKPVTTSSVSVAISPEEIAYSYLSNALMSHQIPSLVLPQINDGHWEFKSLGAKKSPFTATTAVKFRQYYQKNEHWVPIYGSLVTIHLDENNEIVAFNSALGEPDVDPEPYLSSEQVLQIVRSWAGYQTATLDVDVNLYYYFDQIDSLWRLVYITGDILKQSRSEEGNLEALPSIVSYIVDARTGDLVIELPRVKTLASSSSST